MSRDRVLEIPGEEGRRPESGGREMPRGGRSGSAKRAGHSPWREGRDPLVRQLDLPHGDARERVWAAHGSHALRGSEVRTLAAVGAFLACADRNAGLSQMTVRWRRPAILVAFAALVVPLLIEHTLDPQRPLAQIVALPAIAVLSGALVLHAKRSRGFLDSPALRFVGRYSYGMYIWHATVITAVALYAPTFFRRLGPSQSLLYYFGSLTAVVALTILVALCSWYLIERPFVRLKRFVAYA